MEHILTSGRRVKKKVMDAAVEKAYGGKKKIAWMEGATQIKCSEFGDNIIAHM